MLSIIVPVFNEANKVEDLCRKLSLSLGSRCELIFVDGGSTDATRRRLNQNVGLLSVKHRCRVLESPKGRALQMNRGASDATGEHLLFLHADTELPVNADCSIVAALKTHRWGCFNVRLNAKGWAFRVIEWFINHRSSLTQVCTGDQCLFVHRSLFEQLGGFEAIPLMEDVALTKRLRMISSPFRIKPPVLTSARKWKEGGVAQTVWLMWCLRYQYWRGADPAILVTKYYKSH